jgi:hypothetical protein
MHIFVASRRRLLIPRFTRERDVMKGMLVGIVLAGVAMLGGSTATAQSSAGGFDATVESVATVIVGNVSTDFEFTFTNCPAGSEMAVIEWEAEQPARAPGNGVATGLNPFGQSTGERVQHMVLTAFGNFVPGDRWVGSGLVACGASVIPVEGSGVTMSQTGV